MALYPVPVAKLIEEFERLPGVGSKTAQRLAFHVHSVPKERAISLANAIMDAKEKVVYCKECYNISDAELCPICGNPKRNKNVICVVGEPKDVAALERTKDYKGVYHVLHGLVSPMAGIGPEDIKLRELVQRVANTDVTEVIVATNPTIEGEATAMYIAK